MKEGNDTFSVRRNNCPRAQLAHSKVSVSKASRNNVPSSTPANVSGEDESPGDRIDYAVQWNRLTQFTKNVRGGWY